MDSFEWTKIIGAVLSALLLIFGFKTIIEMRQSHIEGSPGYALPGAGPAAAPAKEAGNGHEAAPASKDVAAKDGAATSAKEPASGAATPAGGAATVALLSKAKPENGATIFRKCSVCHTSEKGKPKGIGPNLWGVVNRPKASFEGFEYSPDMKAKGGNWTLEDLSTFIANPKAYVAGTKMIFPGLSNPEDAADLIAYLATLADTPVALPK
jgi:cytochrome c